MPHQTLLMDNTEEANGDLTEAPAVRSSGGPRNVRGLIPQNYRTEVVELLKLAGPVVRMKRVPDPNPNPG